MYAGQIAINYCARDVGFKKETRMLDFPSTSGDPTSEHAHIHTWQNAKTFSKFEFAKGSYKNVALESLNISVVHDYAMYMALSGNSKENRVT